MSLRIHDVATAGIQLTQDISSISAVRIQLKHPVDERVIGFHSILFQCIEVMLQRLTLILSAECFELLDPCKIFFSGRFKIFERCALSGQFDGSAFVGTTNVVLEVRVTDFAIRQQSLVFRDRRIQTIVLEEIGVQQRLGDLDFGCSIEVLIPIEKPIGFLLCDVGIPNLVLDIIQCWHERGPAISQLNDVIPELGLDRRADLSHFQCKGGFFEFGNHEAAPKPIQVTALILVA